MHLDTFFGFSGTVAHSGNTVKIRIDSTLDQNSDSESLGVFRVIVYTHEDDKYYWADTYRSEPWTWNATKLGLSKSKHRHFVAMNKDPDTSKPSDRGVWHNDCDRSCYWMHGYYLEIEGTAPSRLPLSALPKGDNLTYDKWVAKHAPVPEPEPEPEPEPVVNYCNMSSNAPWTQVVFTEECEVLVTVDEGSGTKQHHLISVSEDPSRPYGVNELLDIAREECGDTRHMADMFAEGITALIALADTKHGLHVTKSRSVSTRILGRRAAPSAP